MLALESQLVLAHQIKIERVEGIRKAGKELLLKKAEEALGTTKRLVVRDLIATDLGLTHIEFGEITGTDNTYTSILGGEQTMADNRFAAILGCRLIGYGASGAFSTFPVITAVKITVGGSIVAIWDLYKLFVPAGAASGAGTAPIVVPIGITEAPVIITQNTPFNIETYAIEVSNVALVIEGLVAEPEGKTIKG